MTVTAVVDEICARYLAAFDARHPGRLTGLYLVGSIALGDFKPGRSDIDVVVVTSDPLALGDVEQIHTDLATLHPRPFFDASTSPRRNFAPFRMAMGAASPLSKGGCSTALPPNVIR